MMRTGSKHRRTAAWVVSTAVAASVLAGCGNSNDADSGDKPKSSMKGSATPVVEVGEGCPSAEDYSLARGYDEKEYADPHSSLDLTLLNAYVETPLPEGGCAYAADNAKQANNSDETARRVEVWYFLLGLDGHLKEEDLKEWAQNAGGTVDSTDDEKYDLPDTFSGWLDSYYSSNSGLGNKTIPEFTSHGDYSLISFALDESDVDAIQAQSKTVPDKTAQDPTAAMAQGVRATFEASFDMEDGQGYTVDVKVSGSLSPFTNEVVDSLPGEFEAISTENHARATATNTTRDRNATVPEFAIHALYNVNSDFCDGVGYVEKAKDAKPHFCRVVVALHNGSSIEADATADLELTTNDIRLSKLREDSSALEDLNSPVSIYATFGSKGGIFTSVEARSSRGCQAGGNMGDEWFVVMDGWPDVVCD